MLYCSVNGDYQDTVSALDRGLAYGDGVFTTAKIRHGKIEHLSAHLERLVQSCSRLKFSAINVSALKQQMMTAARDYDLAVIKVVISSGQGGRGYAREKHPKLTQIITVSAFPSHYQQWQQQGISVDIANFKLGLNPALAGLKHLNRLEQVMIRHELDDCEVDELIVANIDNYIVESSCANIFWITDNILYTPDLTDSGVTGIIRAQVLSLYPDVRIVKAKKELLLAAQAAFICNCVMGIVPIRRFNDTQYDMKLLKPILEKIQGNSSD